MAKYPNEIRTNSSPLCPTRKVIIRERLRALQSRGTMQGTGNPRQNQRRSVVLSVAQCRRSLRPHSGIEELAAVDHAVASA